MNGKLIGYWLSTGLIALAMGGSAFGYLSGAMDADMAHLGYPHHFVMLLGTWKGLAALALLAPGFAKLKEWTYAGLFFTFTGAAIAHLAAGDPVTTAVPPLMMGLFATISYFTRPADRVWAPSQAQSLAAA